MTELSSPAFLVGGALALAYLSGVADTFENAKWAAREIGDDARRRGLEAEAAVFLALVVILWPAFHLLAHFVLDDDDDDDEPGP